MTLETSADDVERMHNCDSCETGNGPCGGILPPAFSDHFSDDSKWFFKWVSENGGGTKPI